jgi:hypothetical protein
MVVPSPACHHPGIAKLQDMLCQGISCKVFAYPQARMTDQSHQDISVNIPGMIHYLGPEALRRELSWEMPTEYCSISNPTIP